MFTKSGSVFVNTLVDVIGKHSHNTELAGLIEKVDINTCHYYYYLSLALGITIWQYRIGRNHCHYWLHYY